MGDLVIAAAVPAYSIVVVKHSGEDRYLHVSAGRDKLTIGTAGATRGHNASGATNAFSVAAIRAPVPGTPFDLVTTNRVEFFSSDGPRRIFFQPDGTAISPGDFSSSGGVVLQKPDLTAANGVTTTVPGFDRFYGTSASAPHAGAIAALLWAANPFLPAEEVRSFLVGSAIDLEQPGVDRSSGVGVIMAPRLLPQRRACASERPNDGCEQQYSTEYATCSSAQ
jgi:subtilisin family serine protease